MLRWEEPGAGERSASFPDEDSREEAAKALAEKREGFGTEIMTFDPREWRVWLEFKARTGGADPLLVAQAWVAARERDGLAVGSLTVAEAVKRYYKTRLEENLSPDTYRHIKSHLTDRLVPIHGARPLAELTPDRIREWLAGLKSKRGSFIIGPVARRHHQKNLKTFLDYCVRAGWLARNPADQVGLQKIPAKDPVLLTLAEARKLFAMNAGHRVIGRMALEAFGGQRNSVAGRIRLEELNIPKQGIRIPGPKHKSKKVKYRQGYPVNLWAWIARAPSSCWEMSELEYRNEKREAFVRADIGRSENRLRKTFASAHLAVFKDPPRTAYLMQHSNTETTEIYEGVMDESDAKAYLEIIPK